MTAKIIKLDPGNRLSVLREAAGVLKDGGLVAYPTESFYALGADATNPLAIEWVFRAKKRHPDNPLPVIVHDSSVIPAYAKDISPMARKAIDLLMPGPVTLVLWAADIVPHNITASTGKVAIRVPEQELMLEMARIMGSPIVATSANISGTPGLTTAQAVMEAIGAGIELIIDDGETPGPPASTLLDVTVAPPAVLREGRLKKSSIEKVLGRLKS